MSTTRQAFDVQLRQLEQSLLRMGSLVEEMVDRSVRALLSRDPALATWVIARDDEVDSLNRTIEAQCMQLLALQQPMSKDLRVIASLLRAITDLERVGDYAVEIARMVPRVADHPGPLPHVDLDVMAAAVTAMCRHTLRALVDRDLVAVLRICKEEDDAVDRAYRSLVDELMAQVERGQAQMVPATYFILTVRSLERIADHLTNVAERIQYTETGIFEELG